jgi:hypothetical protein
MKFTFEIDTENDAFVENELAEVQRVIQNAFIMFFCSTEILDGYLYKTKPLFDSNGNCVGTIKISK